VTNPEALRQAILERLSKVVDPETGVDVVHMRLIEDLAVDETGQATCKFRPSSPFCPIAVPLALEIQQAIAGVEGITGQEVEIVGFVSGDELTTWLRQAFDNQQSEQE
jgi:metal-sulfur cluster biosynthetic enzyme